LGLKAAQVVEQVGHGIEHYRKAERFAVVGNGRGEVGFATAKAPISTIQPWGLSMLSAAWCA
jgi:ribosomal protein S5